MTCDPTIGGLEASKPDKRAILLLDDDDDFRRALAETLRDEGYEVFDYDDPARVPSLETPSGPLALITDYRMPTSNGIAVADRFHAVHGDAPIIVMTSYSTESLEAQVAARPYIALCSKLTDYKTLASLLA